MQKSAIVAIMGALLSSLAVAQPNPAPKVPPAIPSVVVGDPGPTGVRIDKDGVFANFFPAKARGRRPAILLLGGSEGGLSPGGEGPIKALTAEGFDVLYLCYFGCPGTPHQLVAVPLETFDRALAFLRRQTGVDPNRIGVVGGSKGGEAALLVATRQPRLKAVVVGMPSSVAWPGVTNSLTMQPSWTSGGAPVPFLPYAFASYAKAGIFGLYNDALPTLAQHPEAAIPVEQVAGPIMLVCGEADTLWPSCTMADQISRRLTSRGRPAPTVLRYADAGHQVFGPPVQNTNSNDWLASLGGTVNGNATARADGWPKVVAFLKIKLRP
ncbi:MAG: acyl-CoA thioester hydrolase/BAAT C-terminal domain-containing protein [Caulobacterales bacterium]